jgi:hypothetical protein
LLRLKTASVCYNYNYIIQGKTKKAPNYGAFIYLVFFIYTENEVPQPQVLAALGLLKVKPRAFKPS